MALPLVTGDEFADPADYLDTCRAKGNLITYDRTGGTSETEVEELLGEVTAFREIVLTWLKANHPQLAG